MRSLRPGCVEGGMVEAGAEPRWTAAMLTICGLAMAIAMMLPAAAAAAAAPPDHDGAAAVRGLLGRLLPPHAASKFALLHTPLSAAERAAGLTDFFELGRGPNATAAVLISGSSGSALASGVRHYLWHYANTSFSWWGDNLANLPAESSGAPLPAPPARKVRRSTTLRYRMAMNSCAFGYSTPYWNITRWVREIDLLALRGVNLGQNRSST